VEERVGEDLDRIGVQLQGKVGLTTSAVVRLAGTGCRGTDCTPDISGAAALITTIVEMPSGASSSPRRTVRPSNANFTSFKRTSLVPESGGVKSVAPLGSPFIDVAAARPGATDQPAMGSMEDRRATALGSLPRRWAPAR